MLFSDTSKIQNSFSTRQRTFFYLFILLLSIPALLINLGTMSLIDDEGIRALVALEMDISGNYITPTIQGEFYYRKPPVYNWFLLIWYNLFGSFDEFVSRFATVFCLAAYALTIFFVSRRYFPLKFAFLNALFFVTCGRVLVYDSMLGLIDIGYSWVTFSAFIVIYTQFKKSDYLRLFLFSYILTAIGFLLKGLPSLVFQASTLLAFFIWKKDFKRLFSQAHFAGIGVFLLIVGSYYFAYSRYNSLEELFNTILFESSRRTAATYGWSATIKHLFTFPFEMIGHFLPWTLLLVLFFQKNILLKIKEHEFISFCVLTFLVNIPAYWLSVEVYPRYLFMHFPLFFTVSLYLWFGKEELKKQRIFVHGALGFLCIALTLGVLLPMFIKPAGDIPYLYLKSTGLAVLLAYLCFLFLKKREERLLITIAVLLVARIGFNWFVIPDRYVNDLGTEVKLSSLAAAEKFPDRTLYVYKNSVIQPTGVYYITRTRREILKKKHEGFKPEDVFLINPPQYQEPEYIKHGEVKVRYMNLTLEIATDLKEK